jgi:hypothetical protein
MAKLRDGSARRVEWRAMRPTLLALLVCAIAAGQAASRGSESRPETGDVRLANGAHIVAERIPGAPGCAVCLAFPIGVESLGRDLVTADILLKIFALARTRTQPVRTFAELRRPGRLFLTETGGDFSLIAWAFETGDLDRELKDVADRLGGIVVDADATFEMVKEWTQPGRPPDPENREDLLKAKAIAQALQKPFLPMSSEYGAGNATLVVVGDFDAVDIAARLRALVAPLPRGAPAPPARFVGFSDVSDNFCNVGEVHSFYRLELPFDWSWWFESGWETPCRHHIGMGWRLPPPASPDFAAALVLAGPYLRSVLPAWPKTQPAEKQWLADNRIHDYVTLKVLATLNDRECLDSSHSGLDAAPTVASDLLKIVQREITPDGWNRLKDDARRRLGIPRKGVAFERQDLVARAMTRARFAQLGIDPAALGRALDALTIEDFRRVMDAVLHAHWTCLIGFG